MYDLLDGTTLAQEIIASLVLPITKILAIKNDKLNIIFLRIAFGSQCLLEPTSDQIGFDIN
jgi:hypothetical protein